MSANQELMGIKIIFKSGQFLTMLLRSEDVRALFSDWENGHLPPVFGSKNYFTMGGQWSVRTESIDYLHTCTVKEIEDQQKQIQLLQQQQLQPKSPWSKSGPY
jgi:hypothetical protein